MSKQDFWQKGNKSAANSNNNSGWNNKSNNGGSNKSWNNKNDSKSEQQAPKRKIVDKKMKARKNGLFAGLGLFLKGAVEEIFSFIED